MTFIYSSLSFTIVVIIAMTNGFIMKQLKMKMNGANFLTCSQGLNCGGTREVRSDVSILKAPLAAASVHCDHTSPTQTYESMWGSLPPP